MPQYSHWSEEEKKCRDLKVHNAKMHESDKEKYLGDIIEQTGKPRATIMDRKAKRYGIVGQVLAIIKEAPFGKWRVKSGLLLRNSWLVNSMLYNNEAWQSIVKYDIAILSRVDESLLAGPGLHKVGILGIQDNGKSYFSRKLFPGNHV